MSQEDDDMNIDILIDYLTKAKTIATATTQAGHQLYDKVHANRILQLAEREKAPPLEIPQDVYRDSKRLERHRKAIFADPKGVQISRELLNRGFDANLLIETPVEELLELTLRPQRRSPAARFFGFGNKDKDLVTPFRYMSIDEAQYRSNAITFDATTSQRASDRFEETVKPGVQSTINSRFTHHQNAARFEGGSPANMQEIDRYIGNMVTRRRNPPAVVEDATGGGAAPLIGYRVRE